ncbi:MAG TPA: tRNA preQ1(34) S-adenosylmethionine ribosyltransferase-isomerase QueA [Thermoanaerobaculia bacterium]|nr:tRNA preQ1(34) S-adenosylmethionine ribosyltransferase-isomerase QueA [Thermoanaerobaculia bacterium]
MKRTDFAYHLPPDLIAQEPRERGRSRMMVVRRDAVEHDSFANFPNRLAPGDVLVLNDTRVIPARLFGRRAGMTRAVEVLLTREREGGRWEAWAKPAKRLKAGDEIVFSDKLKARVEERSEGTVVLRFDGDLGEIDRIGVMPLPPYIGRPEPRDSDRQSYQTVYARERGAIAAPTAGLHFTREMLDEIGKTHEVVTITLHVGIGTFEPVKVDDVAQHKMHFERYEITEAAARTLNDAKSIVAVGTTTVRTLESAVRAGGGKFMAGKAETDIFITPGFEFRAVDKMLTNFHLPESTLLMLVSAFAGMETIRRAYAEAIAHRYLFYSYGDCMFLEERIR